MHRVLNHRFHDVCLVAGSLGETFNPSSEVWVVLPLDRHIKPTPGGDAERYVAYAEFVTGHEGIFLECIIYDGHLRRQRGATQFDDFHVSIFWCSPDHTAKNRYHRRADRCHLPVHPTFGDCSDLQVLGIQTTRIVFCS